MKKALVALTLLMTLCAAGCTASTQTYYEQAQLLLGRGEYAASAKLFSQLGEYRESADYALYAAGLYALKHGDDALAEANLREVAPFKSSGRYLRYLEARRMEASGAYGDAAAAYAALGSFEDCPERAQAMTEATARQQLEQIRALMEAGDYERAVGLLSALDSPEGEALLDECRSALLRQAYHAARSLYDSGDYTGALTAFEALGDAFDAVRQAEQCRRAIYAALEERRAAVTMAAAPALIEAYAALGDYRESALHRDALIERYARTVQLVQQDKPYVAFGHYAAGESGLPAPLLWRVLSVGETEATLLCASVIDAQPVAEPIRLTFSEAEQPAVLAVQHPALNDLTGLTPADMTASATAYAMAQGVRRHSNGSAWWWLSNTVGNSRHAIVWYNGRVITSGVQAAETVVGVRPLLKLSLEDCVFTQGDGSRENPYR